MSALIILCMVSGALNVAQWFVIRELRKQAP